MSTAERAATQVQAAEEKLHQSLQPLLLQADLNKAKLQWNAALEVLRQVADKALRWFEARSRLGSLLFMLGRFREAEVELKAALDLTQSDAEQAEALNKFAMLLEVTNRFSEAEPLMRRALAIDEKIYGAENPSVATDLSSLGRLLQDTNRFAEAEPLMRRALAIDEKSYGAEHPMLKDKKLSAAKIDARLASLANKAEYSAAEWQALQAQHSSAQLSSAVRSAESLTAIENRYKRCVGSTENRHSVELSTPLFF